MSPPRKSNPLTPDSLAAEGAGGADEAIETRLGRYGTGKARNHEMAGHLLLEREKRLSERLYRCASVLHFREWINHDNRVTLHRGHFCQIGLLCPVCAIRRSGKMLRRYVERARYIARTHDLWLVTLTVKNGDDLAERYLHLKHSVRRLRERAKKGYGEFSRADGALWSTEFTRSEKGWHPHVHMVWAVPKGGEPIQWGKGTRLANEWLNITNDSYIVHAEQIQATDENKLIAAFCEVLKYSLKFSEMSLADNFHAYRELKGKRLISSSGIWWGLDLPEDARLEDDPLDGPYIEHIYRYAGSAGYILSDVDSGHVDKPHPVPIMAPQEVPHGNRIETFQNHEADGNARASRPSVRPVGSHGHPPVHPC